MADSVVMVLASKQGLKSLLDHHPELFVSWLSFPCFLDFYAREEITKSHPHQKSCAKAAGFFSLHIWCYSIRVYRDQGNSV